MDSISDIKKELSYLVRELRVVGQDLQERVDVLAIEVVTFDERLREHVTKRLNQRFEHDDIKSGPKYLNFERSQNFVIGRDRGIHVWKQQRTRAGDGYLSQRGDGRQRCVALAERVALAIWTHIRGSVSDGQRRKKWATDCRQHGVAATFVVLFGWVGASAIDSSVEELVVDQLCAVVVSRVELVLVLWHVDVVESGLSGSRAGH
jgi:hypothetical protein